MKNYLIIILCLLTLLYCFTNCNNDDGTGEITATDPCLNAGSCKYALGVENGTESLALEYYANYDIQRTDVTWQNLKSVVIVVHGNNRNADDYFQWMNDMIVSIGKVNETIVLSPHFKTASDINGDNDLIYWSSAGWKTGANSANSNATTYSSYTIVDQFITLLSNKSRFPALEKIIITGHSSGGQFTNLYSAANTIENTLSGIEISYVVANTQYYFYPRNERYDASTQQFTIPSNCSNYNNWSYGTNNLNTYFQNTIAANVQTQFINRQATYLLGNQDTNTGGAFNDSACEATLQGSSRFNRGQTLFNFLEAFYSNQHQHQKVIVNGVGHSPQNMYQSAEGKQLFESLLSF